MANLFNTDGITCHHDATRTMRNPPHLEEVVNYKATSNTVIGDSDNGLPLFPKALNWFYGYQPDLPILIIRRDLDHVRRSLRRLHYGRVTEDQITRAMEVSEEGLKVIAEGPNVMEVEFGDLDDMNVLTDISLHLTGKVIDIPRMAYLRGWNVQMQEPQYSASFSEEFCAVVKQRIGGP
jgi:hypothetical protein